MAILSCWRRWALVRLAGSAAGAVARFGSGLVWTCCNAVDRQSLQQPLAFGPWLALAGGSIFLWQQMV